MCAKNIRHYGIRHFGIRHSGNHPILWLSSIGRHATMHLYLTLIFILSFTFIYTCIMMHGCIKEAVSCARRKKWCICINLLVSTLSGVISSPTRPHVHAHKLNQVSFNVKYQKHSTIEHSLISVRWSYSIAPSTVRCSNLSQMILQHSTEHSEMF